MFRTEIGEPADIQPLTPEDVLNICAALGDSRASLKFLVKQTVPGASSLAPTDYSSDLVRRHSKGGSLSSASEAGRASTSGDDTSLRTPPISSIPRSSSGSSLSVETDPPFASNRFRKDTPTQSSGAGPSRLPDYDHDHDLGMELLAEDPDEETRKLIEQFQREEEEEVHRAQQRRIQQLEADEEMARREQQSERDVWQMMQQMQLENRRRQQLQIEEDEQRAVSRSRYNLSDISARYKRKKIGVPKARYSPHLEAAQI